jgi:hypothetical protein
MSSLTAARGPRRLRAALSPIEVSGGRFRDASSGLWVAGIVRRLGANRQAPPAGPTPCRGLAPTTPPACSDSRHEPARDESVPVERRPLAGFRRRVSAIGGLELAGPSPSRSEKGVAVKRFAVVAGLAVAMVLVGFGSAQPAQAATSTKTVRYGPFTIPAATSTTDPGMIHNKLLFGVARPCVDCHIIAFTPNLVYGDGTAANMNTGPMLHHAGSPANGGPTPPAPVAGWGWPESGSSPPATNAPPSSSRPATAIGCATTTPGTCWSTS